MTSILVLHGPNLSRLGFREPEIYGTVTLEELDRTIRAEAERLGGEVAIHQSNHEGELLDLILSAPGRHQGIVINPGALAHTSLALADALRSVMIPAVEVHLSNVLARDPRRRDLPVAEACRGMIAGLGPAGYLLALRWLLEG